MYKDIWEASVGEQLPCQRENGNRADPFAVAVVKSGVTVGHIPRKISSVCSLFLRRNSVINVCTTDRRRFSQDLPQGGLEIPCLITFEGAGKDVQKVRKLVTASLSTTCTSTAKTYTNDGPPSKRRRTEEGSHNSSEAAVDTNEWVQCGGVVILTNYDRKILATGQKLTDKHINFAQTLLRLQFPKLNGLQSTLYQSRSQSLTTNGNVLQVLHSRGDHWIVATTIRCNPGEVRVFDSVYATLDDGTYETVQRMFGGRTSYRVTTTNVPKQQGGTDCGVFAIAVCTCIAFGGDPSQMVICQAGMRDHLLKCFEEKLLSLF